MWTFADRLLQVLVPKLRASADNCQYVGSGCGEPCQIGASQGFMWSDIYLCTDAQGYQYYMYIPQNCTLIGC
jgi:hypothetical protein